MNKISKIIANNASSDEIYELLTCISSDDVESSCRQIDSECKSNLYQNAKDIHLSMEAYHNAGEILIIRRQFARIEKYLKRLVYSRLSIYERLCISITNFFVEINSKEDMEMYINTIKETRRNISRYNDVLNMKYQEFSKGITSYQNWVSALSRFISHIHNIYDEDTRELHYPIQKLLYQSSEFLSTQRQLRDSIILQIENNQMIINDTMHIITISESLVQNTISIEHFFKEEYIGSVKIIKKYKGPDKSILIGFLHIKKPAGQSARQEQNEG